MKDEEEDMMAVATFIFRLLQIEDGGMENLEEFCRCMNRLKRLMEQVSTDEQVFMASVLNRSNIAFLQMDGMKNRNNYITFRNTVMERPVLMLVRNTTLRGFQRAGESVSSQQYQFVWVEYVTGGNYFLHIGREMRTISQIGLFQIYHREKHNFHSKYFLCAVIKAPADRNHEADGEFQG